MKRCVPAVALLGSALFQNVVGFTLSTRGFTLFSCAKPSVSPVVLAANGDIQSGFNYEETSEFDYGYSQRKSESEMKPYDSSLKPMKVPYRCTKPPGASDIINHILEQYPHSPDVETALPLSPKQLPPSHTNIKAGTAIMRSGRSNLAQETSKDKSVASNGQKRLSSANRIASVKKLPVVKHPTTIPSPGPDHNEVLIRARRRVRAEMLEIESRLSSAEEEMLSNHDAIGHLKAALVRLYEKQGEAENEIAVLEQSLAGKLMELKKIEKTASTVKALVGRRNPESVRDNDTTSSVLAEDPSNPFYASEEPPASAEVDDKDDMSAEEHTSLMEPVEESSDVPSTNADIDEETATPINLVDYSVESLDTVAEDLVLTDVDDICEVKTKASWGRIFKAMKRRGLEENKEFKLHNGEDTMILVDTSDISMQKCRERAQEYLNIPGTLPRI